MPTEDTRPAAASVRRTWLVVGLIAFVAGVGADALLVRHSVRRAGPSEAGAVYTCPMHPLYRSDRPGDCPICGMALVRIEAGAGSAATGSPPAAASGGPASTGLSALHLEPERLRQIGARFVVAETRPARIELRAAGRVAVDERRVAHVHSKVSGFAEEVFVDYVGATVAKGQPLFTLFSPELVASQQDYLTAVKAAQQAARGSIAWAADDAEALAGAARRRLELFDVTAGQIEELERSGRVSRTITVHSPVAGVVTERAVYEHGRTITPDMDLYTIVDLTHAWVLAQVHESEMPHVRVGQPALVDFPYDPGRAPLEGTVTYVAPVVDAGTRTVQARIDVENRDLALKPDAFVGVRLVDDLGPRLVVPEDAVMDSGTRQYVFVDLGEGHLEPRPVVAGPTVAGGRIVEQGLRDGERVAAAANFVIDSESRLEGAFEAMGGAPTGPATGPEPGTAPAAAPSTHLHGPATPAAPR